MQHYMKNSIFPIVLIILICFACERGKKPSLGSFQFPMEIGNSWKYSLHTYSYNWEPDSIGNIYGINIFDTGTTEIVSVDTLFDNTIYYTFETEWTSRDDTRPLIEYIGNNDSGMYLYGYSGSYWTGPPKINANANKNGHFIFKGQQYKNYEELYSTIVKSAKGISVAKVTGNTLTHEDRPIKELTYPLLVGKQWVYRDVDLGDEWDMDRKILNIENVIVPAGKFKCFKIKWYWDIDENGEWDTDISGYDYLAPIGYLKREFNFFGINCMNEHGDTIGTFDSRETYELIDYNINE